MTIRAISLHDYENLFLFWQENYFVSETDDKEHFALFLQKNHELSVLAEEDGKIIGTALGSYDGRRGYLQKVVTNKNSRNQGIGRELVVEVIKRLKIAGALYIPISVEENLIPFYEKCGFIKKDSTSMSLDL